MDVASGSQRGLESVRVVGVNLNGVFERILGLGRRSWLFFDVVKCFWGVEDENWIVWAVERGGPIV